MEIPPLSMRPSSALPNGRNIFYRGGVWVLRRAYKSIVHAVLYHTLYLVCLISLLTMIGLWDSYFDLTVNELNWMPIICFESNNQRIVLLNEIQKADVAASTTLMTLLPALLIFSPFRTARISSLIVFSTSAALLTAGFTLGLATSDVMTLPDKRIFKVKDLCMEGTIPQYGKISKTRQALQQLYTPEQALCQLPPPVIPQGSSIMSSLMPDLTLAVAGVAFQSSSDNPLRYIMLKALKERKRPTRGRMAWMKFSFFFAQTMWLLLLVYYMPFTIAIPIIWLCPNQGNTFIVLWIAITAILAGIIRTYAESSKFSNVEILHLRPLSPSFVFVPCRNCISSTQQVTRLTAISEWSSIRPKISEYLAGFISLARRMRIAEGLPHGMVVVLRPSKVVNPTQFHTIWGVLRGLFQAFMLIFLTALFASTYNSNIIQSTVFLTAFITIMVLSRTCSIYFCAWMEHALDTIQIEYATPAELSAIRTILSGMPSVLIHNTTRNRKYAAGNRLTPTRDCTNHIWSSTKPLPRGIGITSALLYGLIIAAVPLGIFSLVPLHAFTGFVGWTGSTLRWVVNGSLVFFMAKKVYSDFKFVETMEDVRTGTSSV